MIDSDIKTMALADLQEQVVLLRNALRDIRDRTGHDLCWYNPELWDILPEKIQPHPEVPPWCEFMHNCAEFRKKLDSMPKYNHITFENR